MRTVVILTIWIGFCLASVKAGIAPESVALLYNESDPESRELAAFYQNARGIPAENLIGLPMPKSKDISRAQYVETLQNPLREIFEKRGWWKRGYDSDAGITLPVSNRIRVLVTFRGVPLRIQATPKPAPAEGAPPPKDPVAGRDEAAVDSELSMFGVDGVPMEGVLQNRYFKSEKASSDERLPFLVLTSRIDAVSIATCKRMITDAISAEKTGLWGRGYIDIANKFPQGDAWLRSILAANDASGLPTVVDTFNETLPKNYPMTEASIYYGWYDWNVSGPFLNPQFRFRPGAIAVHIHSFSADQLSDASKNWCAPLLEKGAAVTLGNVYEPYLHLAHHLDILHQRLLAGRTWVESAWMAMPVCSWQGVVLGDPLYRPFGHIAGTGTFAETDVEFRALRAAMIEWPRSMEERHVQIAKAVDRMKSGVLAESIALDLTNLGRHAEAAVWYRRARDLYAPVADKMRMDFQLIAADRKANQKESALRLLRDAQLRYGSVPESEALAAWALILDPPPPPPAPEAPTQPSAR